MNDGSGAFELSVQFPEKRGTSSTNSKCPHDRIADAALVVASTGTLEDI